MYQYWWGKNVYYPLDVTALALAPAFGLSHGLAIGLPQGQLQGLD